jgi:hypothetical protein
MESLDTLRSIFVEQKRVKSLCHQLCPDVKVERTMEQGLNVNFVLNCRNRQVRDLKNSLW